MERADKGKVEWLVVFGQPHGFRTLVDVVCNILTRVKFELFWDVTKQMFFLGIDSIDPQHVCMIQSRLLCDDVHNLEAPTDFCVSTGILNTCLKSIPPHYSLDIIKYENSDDIFLRGYETASNSHSLTFSINTFCDEGGSIHLPDMEYDYIIEIDLGTLRHIVKTSISMQADIISFQVDKGTSKNVTHTIFTVGYVGSASCKNEFKSSTICETPGSCCVIRAATDATDVISMVTNMKKEYFDTFSAKYLQYFLKSMERSMITMKLSPEKPLILNYPLGIEESYMLFVLAPKTEDA